MVRKRLWVERRTASMSWEEAVFLTALGGKVRPDFAPRGVPGLPAVKITKVLCPFCREYHSPAEVETCMVLPRNVAATAGSASSTLSALDAGLLKQYSELWAFLTATAFPDGEKRRTGRLSVSCELGLLRVSLTCDETGTYASLSGKNLTTILEDLELRLTDGSLTFKPSQYAKRGRK